MSTTLDWQLDGTRAETVFVRMRVDIDWAHTPLDEDDVVACRYQADVSDRSATEIDRVDDLPNAEIARVWCEKVYIDVLRAELARLV